MSIKIYHGAPGSYKTSGAIAIDFIQAVADGRKIITNIRGLDDADHITDVLLSKRKKVGDGFELLNINTESSEEMHKIRTFFHWADDGVFFFLDEIQEIYPKSYTNKKLEEFNYPYGRDKAHEDGRVETLALAFEKHRHHNWDFVVTSPNILKVHPVVRESAESAFKHKNLATIGIKGRYIEAYHPADTRGSKSDFYSVTSKKIPPYVFTLYSSTATGIIQDTTAGQSLFKNPKVLGLLFFIFALLTFVSSRDAPKVFDGDDETGSEAHLQNPTTNSENNSQNPIKNPNIRGSSVANQSNFQPVLIQPKNPFKDTSYQIVSFTNGQFDVLATTANQTYFNIDNDLSDQLKYRFTIYSKCFIKFQYKGFESFAHCKHKATSNSTVFKPINQHN